MSFISYKYFISLRIVSKILSAFSLSLWLLWSFVQPSKIARGSLLLGIGLPSYVEKRPKIWEAHVSLNLVQKGL